MKQDCNSKAGLVKKIFIINKSDLKYNPKTGLVSIKRKYGKFRREIQVIDMEKR